jgi:aspartate aminotransferase
MNWEFTDRVDRVEESATLAVSKRAAAREAEGADVVDLSVGEPDFETPLPVREAGKGAIDAGHTTYTPANGIRALRAAVAEDLRRRDLDYDPEEVIVTPGGKQALFETVQALVEPGDEVVLVDPAWVSYEAMVSLAGGSVVRVDTTPHDFRLAPALDDLQAVVTDATDLIVVNSPNNPTGAVYSERALAGVRDLAVDHDVPVISDEIYDRVVYEAEPRSLGSLDGMGDRTVTINGFSKSYAMTGWRLGYLAAPDPLVGAAGRVHSHSVTCAANFVQHAGVTALEEVDDAVERMVASFRERRDLVVDLLADRGVDVAVPEGAFYVLVPVPVAEDDRSWAMDAIDEAGVATVPGVAFNAPGHVRISYAASRDRLEEGIERLGEHGFL